MSTLKIKNSDGTWQEVPMLKGDKGDDSTIVRMAPNVIAIPCDADGLCKDTYSTKVIFEAVKGEERINCRCLENHPESDPSDYLGMQWYSYQQCTPSQEGAFYIGFKAGTDPFEGVGHSFDSVASQLSFHLDDRDISQKITFIKVRHGEKGDAYNLTEADKVEIYELLLEQYPAVEEVEF